MEFMEKESNKDWHLKKKEVILFYIMEEIKYILLKKIYGFIILLLFLKKLII